MIGLYAYMMSSRSTLTPLLQYLSIARAMILDLLLRERGRLKENDAKAILLQILSGLKYLHARRIR